MSKKNGNDHDFVEKTLEKHEKKLAQMERRVEILERERGIYRLPKPESR